MAEPVVRIETEDQRERELLKQAERLAGLRPQPGFRLLEETCAAKQERMKSELLRRVLAGLDEHYTQRQVDYDRGFIDALSYFEQVVAGAERKLGKAAEQAAETSEPDEEEDRWSYEPTEDRST